MHFFLILFLLCYQLFGLSDLNHNSVMTAARKLAPNIQNKFELEEIRDHFIEISNSAEYKKAHIIWRFMASLLMTGTQGTLDLYQKILDSGYRRDQSLLKAIGFSWGSVAMNKVENHILEVSNRLKLLKETNQNVCSPQDMDYLKKIMGVAEGWRLCLLWRR